MTDGSFTTGCKEGSQKTEEQEEVTPAREQQGPDSKIELPGPLQV
jgi:hypothetical protein